MRTRLALLNAAVFAVGGGVLLTVTWFSVRQIIEDNSAGVVAIRPSRSVAPPSTVPTPDASPAVEGVVAKGVPERFSEFRANVLADLLTRSLLTLALVAALSVVAALWVAGRSLSRISRVTSAARHIRDENLHARLDLIGPDDEVKELADTFDTMMDRLERSFSDQQQFTAHASHELRTPLTIQRTALEIPLAQGRVPRELEPDIRRALAATDQCENLLASLLTLARGSSGILQHRLSDLAPHVRTAIADVLAEADVSGVTVHSYIRPAPVRGDTPLLAQLAANLITNAVCHNHRGGSVRIEAGTMDTDTPFIEVVNTGPAIDPADLPGLFTAFRRGKTCAKGSGLGLAVVRAVADTHQAALITEPNAGGGLKIRVEFPSSP